MALIQCNFFSESLMRTVPIQVVLPTDKMVFPGQPQPEEKPFKTLRFRQLYGLGLRYPAAGLGPGQEPGGGNALRGQQLLCE